MKLLQYQRGTCGLLYSMKNEQDEVTPEEDLLMDLELELAKRIQPQPRIGGQKHRVTGQEAGQGIPCSSLQIYVQGPLAGRQGRKKRQLGWGPSKKVPLDHGFLLCTAQRFYRSKPFGDGSRYLYPAVVP